MGASLPARRASDPVRSLDNVGPGQAKAGLRSDPFGLTWGSVLKDAVVSHYGSVKAAAISLEVDPSLMMREFGDGKFGRLEKADDLAKAAIVGCLNEAFGMLSTPLARARQQLRAIKKAADEIDQALEQLT